jgi:hypothetical protein
MTRRPVHRIWGGKEACWFVALVAWVPLVGCGLGGGREESDAPPSGPAAPFAPLTLSKAYGYRTLDDLNLTDVGGALVAGARPVVTQVSGPAMEFNVVRGVLYFLAPEEQVANSASVLALADPGGREWRVAFQWSGRVSRATPRFAEPDSIALVGHGIGTSGTVSAQAGAISFTLSGMTGIDPAAIRVSLGSPNGSIAVESWFDWNGDAGTLALKATRLGQFLSHVRIAKTASLSFSFGDPAGQGRLEFEQPLSYASGSVVIAVKTADGAAARELAGTRFVIHGLQSGTTAMGALDASGMAVFCGLAADTYEITEVRLEPGVRLTSFATLPSASSVVNVTITRQPAGAKYHSTRDRLSANAGGSQVSPASRDSSVL